MTYEYKIVRLTDPNTGYLLDDNVVIDMLNALGKEGWMAITVILDSKVMLVRKLNSSGQWIVN